jgi:hypothetical protein
VDEAINFKYYRIADEKRKDASYNWKIAFVMISGG